MLKSEYLQVFAFFLITGQSEIFKLNLRFGLFNIVFLHFHTF